MSEQYQKEYDEAMKKLEAGDSPITPEQETQEKTDEDAPNEIETLKDQLARQEKALKDTQRWGHENAAKLAKLERERSDEIKKQNRPPILDANPGLEDAIRHVAPTEPKKPDVDLAFILENSVPNLIEMLEDEDFKNKFIEVRDKVNGAWEDPLVAIRDVNNLVLQTTKDKAVAKAQKDFLSKQKKLDAMSIPGGSGGADSAKEVNEAQAVWDLPKTDFEKMRRKALGY